MVVLALERLAWGIYAVPLPIMAIGPVAFLISYSVTVRRKTMALVRELTGVVLEQQAQIDRLVSQLVASPGQPVTAAAAGGYIKRWQESQPMSPEAVASVCDMVIDHLHLTIRDLDDQHVATMILTCCEVLDQMRAVAEDDQEAIDAAQVAWKAMFE